MKRKLASGLAVLLGASLLAGCGRSAVADATTAAGTDAGAAGTDTAAEQTAGTYTYADTVAWDAQYDVVVAGFGGAGSMAAKTAADAGANVLILEKAPEGHEGGNTRYCGQLFVYGHGDYDATLTYYKQLKGQHEIPDAMLEVYAKSISQMEDIVAEDFGLDKADFVDWTGDARIGSMSPEYPEFEGSHKISLNTLHDGISDGYLWNCMRKTVEDRADKIDVWFESPAVKLIQDPVTKTVVGVTAERGGEQLNVRALNGVVLATGGFENNPEMVADYLGLTDSNAIGSLYNTGDGVRMAMEVGADLWHMEAYEGIGALGGLAIAADPGERVGVFGNTALTTGASIYVTGDGSRYLKEDEYTRHGHIEMGGAWMNMRMPLRGFVVCSEEQYQKAVETKPLPENARNIISADTVEELAEKMQVDAETLKNTIDTFNGYAKTGYDPQFGRAAGSMAVIQAPYRAVEMQAGILNTQGGPRRNENAEVLDVSGQAIPNLYSAGELGGITAFQYQGGGNIAECITFGKIAGQNAAEKKADLPAYEPLKAAESSFQYTIGVQNDLTVAPAADSTEDLADNEYLGEGAGMGGRLVVKVTMDGEKIADVTIVSHSETDGISDPAREQIPAAIVAAQSAEVDAVSGATITSNAIMDAVKDALTKVN